jgi:hypothetical protein
MNFKIFFLSLFCASTVLIAACHKQATSEEVHFPYIAVNTCDSTTINNINFHVCLDSVQDSRCPANVECFWAGYASCRFTVTFNNQTSIFKLSTVNLIPYLRNDTIINGYKFKLDSLYPSSNSPVYSDYKVKVSIK